ncbi:MAG: TonB-dependent receptor [Bacteroidia bacterium]
MIRLRHLILFILFLSGSGVVLAQKTATVYGTVSDVNGIDLENTLVTFIGSTSHPVYADRYGKYELTIPGDRDVTLIFSNLEKGYKRRETIIKVNSGEHRELNITLELIGRTVIITDQGTRMEEIQRVSSLIFNTLPSASGDFNTTLKFFGATNNNELSSQYSVRGGSFDENLVYVNDIEVYRPFLSRSGQSEGLSFVNPDMVSSVLFSTGGWEAKYGDKMSSVLDVQYRRPREVRGTVSGSLLGGSAEVEGISKDLRFTYMLGVRYKSNAYLLKTLDTRGDYKPNFTDAQLYLTYDLNESWQLSFLGNLARNQYLLIPTDRQTQFGTLNQALQLDVYFDGREVSTYQTDFGALTLAYHRMVEQEERLKLKFITSVFRSDETETADIQGQYFINDLQTDFGKPNFGQVISNRGVGTFLNHTRDYLQATVANLEHKGWYNKNKRLNLSWGARYQVEMVTNNLSEWKMIDSAGYTIPYYPNNQFNLLNVVKSENSLLSNRAAAYFQNVWHYTLKDTSLLTATLGARANYWDVNGQTVLSPRGTIAYKPRYRKKDIVFRASAGLYYQPPFFRELIDPTGILHTDVKAQQSIHTVLTMDEQFKMWNRPFKFVVEAYFKQLNQLNPYRIDDVHIVYDAANTGTGYATGIDLKLNGEFIKGTESWLNIGLLQAHEKIANSSYYTYRNSDGQVIIPGYTFNSKAVDSTKHTPGYIPLPTDQLVTFNLFFQDELPRWPDAKMHLSLLYGTPLPFGAPNTAHYQDTLRMPSYRRVDIGFSYQLIKETKPLKKSNPFHYLKSAWVGMEVLNLLQTNNTISYLWIKDVTGRQYAVPNYLTGRQISLRLVLKF